MVKAVHKLIVVMALLIVISTMASAQTPAGRGLQARYDHLTCLTNFLNDEIDIFNKVAQYTVSSESSVVINSTNSSDGTTTTITKRMNVSRKVNLSVSNLSTLRTLLTTDLRTAKKYADGSNTDALHKHINTTFSKNIHKINENIQDVKKRIRLLGLNETQKKDVKAEFKIARSNFANCTSKAEQKVAQAMLDNINEWTDKWAVSMRELRRSGIATSELQKIVDKVDTNIIPQLEDAASADTTKERSTILKAMRDQHLRLWIQFEIARIKLYLAEINPADSSDERAITKLLDEANRRAKDKTLSEDDIADIKNNIKTAGKKTRQLAADNS